MLAGLLRLPVPPKMAACMASGASQPSAMLVPCCDFGLARLIWRLHLSGRPLSFSRTAAPELACSGCLHAPHLVSIKHSSIGDPSPISCLKRHRVQAASKAPGCLAALFIQESILLHATHTLLWQDHVLQLAGDGAARKLL